MAIGVKPGERNGREVYGDIIDLPHWEPNKKHPRMSLHDRAAQFAPFAALSGYDEMVEEEARLVDQKIELSEEDLRILNQKLSIISTALDNRDHPAIAITYFVPDPLKYGGKYETVAETVKRIDPVHRVLILERKTGIAGTNVEIKIGDILDIRGELVDGVE